jgi:excisionase family DNA binding protein
MPEVEWLTVREAADLLARVSTKTVYKLFYAGQLAGVKIGGCVRIRADS